jgi:hypothetical protein
MLRSQEDGLIEGLEHAPLISPARSGDIEGRAMVHRRTDHGEAHGDIDAFLNPKNLDRTMALVMVHGDHKIKVAALGAEEQGVSRKRAFDTDAARLKRLHGWFDLLLLFAMAKQTVFAGMRIDSAHPDAGLAIPERTRASWPRRIVRSTSPGSILAMASIRPM